MPDLDPTTVALLVLAGLTAGWVDAVVGGGGLIQLPALLLVPGMSPVQALATNKLGSIMGTSVSSITYYRRVGPDLTTAGPMAAAALAGAVGGAALATQIPAELFTPIILVVLIGVAVFTLARPQLGRYDNLRWEGNRHRWTAAGIGLVIGAYDGLLGPGTGTFLVISLVSILGYAFLPASALAKIVNFATNLGALIFFVPAGAVVWSLGLAIGVANLVGGYVGARMAVSKGSRFVRAVFVVVVGALICTLGYDVVTAAA
ncbi:MULTISPECIES: TSUP family transporter [unclassified Isoptericola]|uniref:TSUP family transporter n=1 Tax=unclassified Isoptericola TaxID=2623355 RepID=UPI002712FF66|nr:MULTISPECIES: TSUP family transporter [unclassified Isoptericola]MDO8145595.1 TSUP family transporter [Isoptericola sp. 178]MDO8149209.1 TSUP family transporter [Isoptericola sp. b515]MDO8152148.1 TSUP family transporter [Isoptericola sp. b408]